MYKPTESQYNMANLYRFYFIVNTREPHCDVRFFVEIGESVSKRYFITSMSNAASSLRIAAGVGDDHDPMATAGCRRLSASE
ncbi:hypothetical protein [Nocardia vinacea]|uniref:hypothetical protein n=1 Tax=Nocardia vinacea TaxID=96468 RepID=UPI0005944F37|nr:hypothetical protein [Nocardia vinacea]